MRAKKTFYIIIDASNILKICKNIYIVNWLMHHNRMNTATKLLTSPFLLSITARPRPPHVRSVCQSPPGHARLTYVPSVNHRQATPASRMFRLSITTRPRPPHVSSVCQSLPGHARLTYVPSVNHHQATPASRMFRLSISARPRLPRASYTNSSSSRERVNREKMAEFIQLNKPTEPKPASQNREHHPHPHPSPAKKIRHEEKVFKAKKMNGDTEQQNYSSKPKNKKTKTEKDREKEKGKEKERKKHKLAAENPLSVKKENGELKLSQKGIASRFAAAARALFGADNGPLLRWL